MGLTYRIALMDGTSGPWGALHVEHAFHFFGFFSNPEQRDGCVGIQKRKSGGRRRVGDLAVLERVSVQNVSHLRLHKSPNRCRSDMSISVSVN